MTLHISNFGVQAHAELAHEM